MDLIEPPTHDPCVAKVEYGKVFGLHIHNFFIFLLGEILSYINETLYSVFESIESQNATTH
jgi:hypothetical protein